MPGRSRPGHRPDLGPGQHRRPIGRHLDHGARQDDYPPLRRRQPGRPSRQHAAGNRLWRRGRTQQQSHRRLSGMAGTQARGPEQCGLDHHPGRIPWQRHHAAFRRQSEGDGVPESAHRSQEQCQRRSQIPDRRHAIGAIRRDPGLVPGVAHQASPPGSVVRVLV
jgi:hypothetical protein